MPSSTSSSSDDTLHALRVRRCLIAPSIWLCLMSCVLVLYS